MRRKSDMWQDFSNSGSFLPGEGEQATAAAAADVRERLAMVEEQLRSQFTSMAAYAQISQQAIETARAESRADLDREKATIVSLVERVRDEALGESGRSPLAIAATPPAPSPSELAAAARIAMLEDRFEELSREFAQTLKYQEALANSIAIMFERQLQEHGWLASCGEASV
ncbi:MAG: hypothetical protein JWL72_2096 [Ilumatobacteraceae bacterium]|nr:hypothetical protein [Ilumatobacteraceae bacterium]